MNSRVVVLKRLLQDHGLSVTTARVAVPQALQEGLAQGPAQVREHRRRSTKEIRAFLASIPQDGPGEARERQHASPAARLRDQAEGPVEPQAAH